MKSTKSVKSSASTVGPKKSTAGPSVPVPKKPAQLPEVDEKDDYIMAIKGQVYLLTIENEMLRRHIESGGSPTAEVGAGAGPASSGSASRILGQSTATASPRPPISAPAPSSMPMSTPSGAAALNASNASAAMLASDLPPPTYPQEITDAFEVMRQKYATLEGQYQHDLDEKRRAAEALASQCAAQSSYIITLKREVEAANDTLSEQKRVSQQVEQRAQVDLEVARTDIAALQERIKELNGIVDDFQGVRIKALQSQISELKTQMVNHAAERNASEQARIRALESYGRQFIATRMLVRGWKAAKLEILNLGALAAKVRKSRARLSSRLRVRASSDSPFSLPLPLFLPPSPFPPAQLREEKDTMQKRTDRAEMDAAKARASEAAATQVLQSAYDRARDFQDALSTSQAAVANLQSEILARDVSLAELDGAVIDLQRKLDASQNACAKAVQHREHAMREVSRLQALLTDKCAEADTLRAEAVTAQRKEAEAKSRAKALEEELAQWHARSNTFEQDNVLQERTLKELTSQIETLSQQVAEREQQVTQLSDELNRRPPIDVIRQLDVDNLLQRNVQAATAMQQLLAWQEQHAALLSSVTGVKGGGAM
jgi:hypothetical protein